MEKWIESWNAKGYKKLFCNQYSKVNGILQSDGRDGYYVGMNEEPETTYQGVGSVVQGYRNTLYFPHTVGISNCYGYWLASPSAANENFVLDVNYNSDIHYDYFNGTGRGIRPVAYLPAGIAAEKNAEGVWEIK